MTSPWRVLSIVSEAVVVFCFLCFVCLLVCFCCCFLFVCWCAFVVVFCFIFAVVCCCRCNCFFAFVFVFFYYFIYPCRRIWSVYLGNSHMSSATHFYQHVYSISCVRTMLWLPVLRIFSRARTCWCRRLHTGAVQIPWWESTVKACQVFYRRHQTASVPRAETGLSVAYFSRCTE